MVFPVEILGIYVSRDHDFVGHHGKPRGQNPVSVVAEAECVAGQGIRGDRYFGFKENYKGQVTFFDQAVHEAVQTKFGVSPKPHAYRRNVLLCPIRPRDKKEEKLITCGFERRWNPCVKKETMKGVVWLKHKNRVLFINLFIYIFYISYLFS